MTLPPDRQLDPVMAPELSANGVSGTPISWCSSPLSCADGGIDLLKPAPYPDVRAPITFQPAQRLTGITVHVEAPGRDDVQVAVEGTDPDGVPLAGEQLVISELPAGDWAVLQVSVGFVGGGDAGYVWELLSVRASP